MSPFLLSLRPVSDCGLPRGICLWRLFYDREGALDRLESVGAENGSSRVDAGPVEQLDSEIELQANACSVERLAESYGH